MDKNGDGILQYVMLEGEMGHQDTILRSDYVLQTIEDGGVKLQKLDAETADWMRSRADAIMEQWIAEMGDEIELVLCNNDDMALGAADALKRKILQQQYLVLMEHRQGLRHWSRKCFGQRLTVVQKNREKPSLALLQLWVWARNCLRIWN